MFDLSVRDDGTPVVLYRDPSNDDLVLISCEDAQCADRTTNTLPIDPADSWGADLAIDATGRPLIAAASDDGHLRHGRLFLHSCTDRACTSLESSLVSLGQPLGGSSGGTPTSFMVVDGHERPTFLLRGDSGTEVLQCREARCGL